MLIIYICIYLIIACFCWTKRRKKFDDQIPVIQHNVQHIKEQNNIIDVSHENSKSIYNNTQEIAMDNAANAINTDKNKCDDIRNEGEIAIASELDAYDTDIGRV